MVRKVLFITVIIGCFTGFGFAAAGNQATQSQPTTNAAATAQKSPAEEATVPPPVITFEYTEYDFGSVDPSITVKCDFKFKNTGGSLLKIQDVQPSCGCILTELKKKEFQPGESGEFSISFSSGTTTGEVKKYVYVLSNDNKEPKLTCTIKANVVRRVQISPDPIMLSLRKPNAGCPDINVFSIDGKEFAITGFSTVPDCMSLVFDPCSKATKFLIKPTVDIKILNRSLRGTVFINTNHPQCKTIVAVFDAPAFYKTQPPTFLLFNAEPGKPMMRDKVWLTSNYNEDFEIESTSSENGYVKAANIEKVSSGRFSLNLQITPPNRPSTSQPLNFFTDNFIIKIKNGDRLEIPLRAFYTNPKAATPGK